MLAGSRRCTQAASWARGSPEARRGRAFDASPPAGLERVEAVAAVVGADRIVYGSDRPVLARPWPIGAADGAWGAAFRRNAARILRGKRSAVAA